jgi:hypothetical protein
MRASGKTIARVELADESGKSRIDAHCVLLVELVIRKIADVHGEMKWSSFGDLHRARGRNYC